MARTLVVAGVVLVALTGVAAAQSEADQRRACMGDALRFCSGAIPDRQKISACLAANREAISPGCRSVIDGGGQKPRPARRG